MKIKLISMLLALTMLAPIVPSYAENTDDWTINAELGGSWSDISFTSGTLPVEKTIDDALVWEIIGSDKKNYAISADLSSASAQEIGNNNVLVEVDYYDDLSDETAWFYIKYNSRDESACYTDKVRTTGTKQWKTASFILEAPIFSDSGTDFYISTLTDVDYSPVSVYIRNVRIKPLDEIKPVSLQIMTNRVGNIYFDDEEWTVGIKTQNKVDTDYEMDVTVSLKDINGNVVHSQKDVLTLSKNTENTKDIKINYDRFGAYTICVEAVNNELKYRASANCGISYVKKSGFINDRFGANNKFGYMSQDGNDPDTVYALMKNAGIGWSRDEVFWKDFELESGKYALNERHKEYMRSAQDAGIKQLIICGYGNKLHTASNSAFPSTTLQMSKFGKYVYELTKQANVYGITNFEILNEYNHYNEKRDLTLYDDICKVTAKNARKAAEELGTDVNLVGFAASQYNATEFINETFSAGGGEYVDVVSFHNYHSGSPIAGKSGKETKDIREFIDTQYPQFKGMPVWKTEFGWSRGTATSWNTGSDALGQAKYIPQEVIVQLEAGAERVFQYQLMNWHTEDNTAITGLEMAWGMLDTFSGIKNPYAARPAYVAVSAMNSFLGTPEFKKKTTVNNVNIYSFTRKQDGADASVIWTEKGIRDITIESPTADLKFYDMYANPIDVLKIDNSYYITVTDEHIYMLGADENIKIISKMAFYDDFENYADGELLKNDKENGVGWVKWNSENSKWEVSAVFKPYDNPVYGNEAMRSSWQTPEYNFPSGIDNGKFAISFDLKILSDAEVGNQVFLYLMNGKEANHFLRWFKNGLTTDDWTGSSLGKTFEHKFGTWGHYDIVLDYEENVIKVYADNELWHTEPMMDVTGIQFRESNSRFALDNFHARHIAKNIAEVQVDKSGKRASISFRSAVDLASINPENIQVVDEEQNPQEFTINNVNMYGAELEFADGLTAGRYTLSMSNISGILGEALSQSEFAFDVKGAFKVNSISVVDKNDNLMTATSWKKDDEYIVKADVFNNLNETKSFYAIISGFSGKQMTAVSLIKFENIAKSGNYTAEIKGMDLAGATELRLFAFDSILSMKPLMDSVNQ